MTSKKKSIAVKKIDFYAIVQILIGLIFLSSGVLKSLDSQEFARVIANYGFVWGGYLSPIIAGLEVILGLCLIFQIYPKYSALTALVLTFFFTLTFTFGFFAKDIQDCGCMGPLVKILPTISFARDILIILGSYWVWKHNSNSQANITKLKLWIIYILGGLTLTIAGYTLAKPIVDKNNIKVGERINQNFLKPFDHLVGKGISFVFIFDTACIKCWNVLANIKSIKNIPEFNTYLSLKVKRKKCPCSKKWLHFEKSSLTNAF